MKHNIFISSTYGDLIPYRKKIWEDLSHLSITILGMEKFGARKSAPLDTCLEEVAKSDIFIGIISFRFGSVDKLSKKSFTQLEYEKAFSLDKEIMIYLMDDNALVYANNVDKGTKALKLENFKKLLKDRHTIDTFKEPDELAKKINDRLNVLIRKLSRKSIRPKTLDCKLTRFRFHGENWIAFVGYFKGKPYEIFTGIDDPEIFPIRKDVEYGKIIKNFDDDGEIRFDFQVIDKYGYRKTMGGLSHMFTRHTHRYSSIITKLLQKNVSFEEIIDVIDDMDMFEDYSSKEWKQGVKRALRKK
jgi:hypothetical protein